MNATVVFILVYVLLQLAIAAWVSRRVRSEEDYLVAGRSLGPALTGFAVFATWFGAESCIGAAGAAYDEGIAGNTGDPFGYGLCLLLMGVFFARRLWRRKLTTLADLYRTRYGVRAEKLAVVLIVPASLFWGAAQIRAFGQVLAAVSDWHVMATTTFAAGVVIVYTAVGGLRADAVTDLVQGLTLVAGLLLLAGAVFLGSGGAFASIPAARLELFPSDASWFEQLEDWAIPVCGSLFAAELVARVIAARTPGIAAGATTAAAFGYLAIGVLVVGLGLVGRELVPGLAHGEQVLLHLAQTRLPAAVYAVFAGALVAAILSTVDSVLLVAGSLTAHNVLIPWLGIRGERARLRWNRAAVAVCGVLAYSLALGAESVYGLVEEASAFGSAGLFVTTLVALCPVTVSERAALVAIVAGAATYMVGAYFLELRCPYLVSLGAALVSFAGMAALDGWRYWRGRSVRLPHSAHEPS